MEVAQHPPLCSAGPLGAHTLPCSGSCLWAYGSLATHTPGPSHSLENLLKATAAELNGLGVRCFQTS